MKYVIIKGYTLHGFDTFYIMSQRTIFGMSIGKPKHVFADNGIVKRFQTRNKAQEFINNNKTKIYSL